MGVFHSINDWKWYEGAFRVTSGSVMGRKSCETDFSCGVSESIIHGDFSRNFDHLRVFTVEHRTTDSKIVVRNLQGLGAYELHTMFC
jgi:hypothetical protein